MWLGGTGFYADSRKCERAVDVFEKAYLVSKTKEQLLLIVYLPWLHVTPELLLLTGLSTGLLDPRWRHSIYIKFAVGDPITLTQMSKSKKVSTRDYAKRHATFLDGYSTPPALSSHPNAATLTADPSKPNPFHIGRCCTGKAARHACETGELKRFDVTNGARTWMEGVVYSPQQSKDIVYYGLARHDDKVGAAWTEWMVRTTPVLFERG